MNTIKRITKLKKFKFLTLLQKQLKVTCNQSLNNKEQLNHYRWKMMLTIKNYAYLLKKIRKIAVRQ